MTSNDTVHDDEVATLRERMFEKSVLNILEPFDPENQLPLSHDGMAYLVDSESERLGLTTSLGWKVYTADTDAIDRLCADIEDALDKRDELRRNGKTQIVGSGKAISDEFVKLVIVFITRALKVHGVNVPDAFDSLVRRQLFSENANLASHYKSQLFRLRIATVVAKLPTHGKRTSMRNVAKILEVNASSIMRAIDEPWSEYVDKITKRELERKRARQKTK